MLACEHHSHLLLVCLHKSSHGAALDSLPLFLLQAILQPSNLHDAILASTLRLVGTILGVGVLLLSTVWDQISGEVGTVVAMSMPVRWPGRVESWCCAFSEA
eukprot:1121318-Pelagomonas_calceolata.AAC.1